MYTLARVCETSQIPASPASKKCPKLLGLLEKKGKQTKKQEWGGWGCSKKLTGLENTCRPSTQALSTTHISKTEKNKITTRTSKPEPKKSKRSSDGSSVELPSGTKSNKLEG